MYSGKPLFQHQKRSYYPLHWYTARKKRDPAIQILTSTTEKKLELQFSHGNIGIVNMKNIHMQMETVRCREEAQLCRAVFDTAVEEGGRGLYWSEAD